jgi:antitoxin ParD1/3/4
MANVEKVSVALTPEMAELVRRAVQTGEYASTSEVIREALREWKSKRRAEELEIEELRRLWEQGLASGPGRFKDLKALRREAHRRKQDVDDGKA